MALSIFAWNDDLVTGHATIDAQHQTLFKALGDFRQACSSGKGRETVDKTLTFMVNYTAEHFALEESLQTKFQYPDRVNHKQLHEAFKKTVQGLVEEMRAQGATITVFNKVNSTVGNWLVAHVTREDKKVAAHIRAAGG